MQATAQAQRDREQEVERLETEMAQMCGMLNAATAGLVALVARAAESEAWEAAGIHSAEQWVAWQCGLSTSRARSLVLTARRMAELPETAAAFAAGELSEDQVAVVCRRAPAAIDAEVAELARSATVSQLRRVLRKYSFEDKEPTDEPEPPPEEPRRWASATTTTERGGCRRTCPPTRGRWWKPPCGPPARSSSPTPSTPPAPGPVSPTCRGPMPWWRWPRGPWPPRPRPVPIGTATWWCCTWAPTATATCTSARPYPKGCAGS